MKVEKLPERPSLTFLPLHRPVSPSCLFLLPSLFSLFASVRPASHVRSFNGSSPLLFGSSHHDFSPCLQWGDFEFGPTFVCILNTERCKEWIGRWMCGRGLPHRNKAISIEKTRCDPKATRAGFENKSVCDITNSSIWHYICPCAIREKAIACALRQDSKVAPSPTRFSNRL